MPRKTKRALSSEIYSGTAQVGIISAWATAILFTIGGIVMIVIGSIELNKKIKLDQTVGTIVNKDESKCTRLSPDLFDCVLDVKYNVVIDGVQALFLLNQAHLESNLFYKASDTIPVYYDSNNPEAGQLKPGTKKDNTIGIILIVCGIVLPLLAWLWLYVVRRSKFAAALGGFVGIADLIKF